ncbi:hypothetical protein CYMTET_46735 [Cymbomonas tetramitiformis]|uniref:Uncharacterized protein n=1 Tax=Cymbomonas tetramitiformis TaxID=36881 RepID=A0AAE0EXB6_9CHLO|nr:hypothetical protein CYMTET_46735 [Cymbomonas tetramitiformis]
MNCRPGVVKQEKDGGLGVLARSPSPEVEFIGESRAPRAIRRQLSQVSESTEASWVGMLTGLTVAGPGGFPVNAYALEACRETVEVLGQHKEIPPGTLPPRCVNWSKVGYTSRGELLTRTLHSPKDLSQLAKWHGPLFLLRMEPGTQESDSKQWQKWTSSLHKQQMAARFSLECDWTVVQGIQVNLEILPESSFVSKLLGRCSGALRGERPRRVYGMVKVAQLGGTRASPVRPRARIKEEPPSPLYAYFGGAPPSPLSPPTHSGGAPPSPLSPPTHSGGAPPSPLSPPTHSGGAPPSPPMLHTNPGGVLPSFTTAYTQYRGMTPCLTRLNCQSQLLPTSDALSLRPPPPPPPTNSLPGQLHKNGSWLGRREEAERVPGMPLAEAATATGRDHWRTNSDHGHTERDHWRNESNEKDHPRAEKDHPRADRDRRLTGRGHRPVKSEDLGVNAAYGTRRVVMAEGGLLVATQLHAMQPRSSAEASDDQSNAKGEVGRQLVGGATRGKRRAASVWDRLGPLPGLDPAPLAKKARQVYWQDGPGDSS